MVDDDAFESSKSLKMKTRGHSSSLVCKNETDHLELPGIEEWHVNSRTSGHPEAGGTGCPFPVRN
jgi:hypothetical protein